MPAPTETPNEQFTREYPELFAYISRFVAFRVPHAPSAEDIVSETFLYGYARLSTYRAERGSLRQWLTGIAKRKIADHWKRMRPSTDLLEALDVVEAAERPSPDASIDASLAADRILSTLSPEARAILTLRFVDGLSHDEIARLVRKKPSTVRTFFSRTLSVIRKNHRVL